MGDDHFDELLAEYDEGLASGTTPVAPTSSDDPQLERRLVEASACLDLLESAFPRHAESARDGHLVATALATLFPRPTAIGRFVIRRELGRGGHGVVFLAFDPVLKREVALKVPRPEILPSAEMRLRFRREAEAAARLAHPNLVPLHEAGEIGPVCYLVSAYCPGPTLAAWLQIQTSPVSPAAAVRLVAPLADAVGSMHRQGILHRDIKPGNVILQIPVGQDGESTASDVHLDGPHAAVPRITDFGLAQFAEQSTLKTRTGAVLGTPGYMAPEQAEGQGTKVGPATDVYALGVLLYELLTGRAPFQGVTELDTLRQVVSDDPQPPRRVRRDVSRELDTVVMKCLEKEPARRYQTAQELADELKRIISSEPIRARPVGAVGRTVRWCRRRPAAAMLIGMTATAMMALVVMAFIRNRELSAYNTNLERLNENLAGAAREAREQQQIAESHARQVSEGSYAVHMSQAALAAREGDTREAATLLESWAPAPGQRDYRGFEYWYLQQQVRLNGQPLLATGSPLYILSRSPDGKTVAAGGKQGTVWLFDESTGAPMRTIATGQIEVNGIAFSAEGRELATAGDDGTIRFWNLDTGDERLCIRAHPQKAYQIVFIDGGSSIALCGSDPHIRVFDVSTGKLQYSLTGHTDHVQSLALDDDGRTLVSTSSDRTSRLWDLEKRAETGLYKSDQGIVPVVISRQPPLLVIGNNAGTVELRQMPDGRELGSAEHLDTMRALALHPDGTLLASADAGGSIRLWRLRLTGEFEARQVALWQAHRGGVGSLIWSSDGSRLLSAGADGRVVGWSLAAALNPRPRMFSVGYAEDVKLIPNTGLLVTTGQPLTVWNWRTGAQVQILPEGGYWRASVSRDGRLIAATTHSGMLRVFGRLGEGDDSRYEYLAEWDSEGELTRVEIAPDSHTVAVARWRRGEQNAGHEHVIWVLSLPDLREKQQLPPASISQMAFAPDGDRLALRTVDGLAMWSRRAQKMLWEVPQTDAEALTFSSDGELLYSRIDGRSVVVRTARDGEQLLRLATHRQHLKSLAVTPDGRTLVTADIDGMIRLSHLPTGRTLFDLPNPDGRADVVGFSADGRTLVCVVGDNSAPRGIQIVVFEAAGPDHDN